MLTSQIGLEAEFVVRNKDNDLVMPMTEHTDDFPVLGEVRGVEGSTTAETVSNFTKAHLEAQYGFPEGHRMYFSTIERLPLDLYKQAVKACTSIKGKSADKVRNIYGTDLSSFSDQIVKDGKIQGANVSCGLHVHFSCMSKQETRVLIPKYQEVKLPLSIGKSQGLSTTVTLYSSKGYDEIKTLSAEASVLTKPVIEWIVEQMDDAFFDRFAPEVHARTKYRQPGFFELKPYGFEYRSLPCNQAVIEALPEITYFAFDLLAQLDSWRD